MNDDEEAIDWKFEGKFSIVLKPTKETGTDATSKAIMLAVLKSSGFTFKDEILFSVEEFTIHGSENLPHRQGITITVGGKRAFINYDKIEKVESDERRILWPRQQLLH